MDHNLLVAARTEYTEQLQEILGCEIYKEMRRIWDTCKKDKKIDVLKEFQRRLCSIPEWNQEFISSLHRNIIKGKDLSVEYLDKIIEAVFLSNVKILSVVKLNDKKQTINVSVPDSKHFIHRCYIETARKFFCDPYLIDDRENGSNTGNEIQRNIKRSNTVIKESIERTIRSMIPMEDILNKYLDASGSEEEQEPVHEEPEEVHEEPEEVHEEPEHVYEEPVYEDTQDIEFDSRPDYVERVPTPELFEHKPEEKLHVDLKETDKNFFTDSE